MQHETIKWKSNDGIEIFGQYWKTEQEEKAVIALVHGFGEHSSRYDHVAAMFNNNGYSVFAIDHRGHGKSGGQRGHTPSYDHFMQDLDLMLQKIHDLFPQQKVIIYGHSMGGGIVTNYLIRKKPDVIGAIVTGPFYRTAEPPPAFQLFLGKLMVNIWGAFPDKAKVPAEYISRDTEVVNKYKNDPLVHNKMSAMLGISLLETGEYAIEHAKEIEVPLLVLHGESDKLTDYKGSVAFKANAGSNVSLETFPGLYHEIHNEPEKQMVFDKIIAYCDKLI
jgi:acylglycerol lipase